LLPAPSPIRELHGLQPGQLTDELLKSPTPWVARGLAAAWPLVRAARTSQLDASRYLLRFYRGERVTAMIAAPESEGRYFYNADLSGFNFDTVSARLDKVLEELYDHRADAVPPTLYVGSTHVDHYLPGLRGENDLPLGARDPLVSLWLGNRSRIAAHFDVPDNLAVAAAGRRRFTLFPPEQLSNLYVGPLDLTPAGQSISLVDFAKPDLERFPRFAKAWEQAQVAELEPGDALFIPSMWWHHVEGLTAFNILVNYWWRQSPPYMDTPTHALMLAMLALRDLPREQRNAWQERFRWYVFESEGEEAAHIPPAARRSLAPVDENAARAIRMQLLNKLNR
jgi:hypothetical protein